MPEEARTKLAAVLARLREAGYVPANA